MQPAAAVKLKDGTPLVTMTPLAGSTGVGGSSASVVKLCTLVAHSVSSALVARKVK